jgi:hypothetical protein
MRKRVWVAIVAAAVLGVGGLVYAHSVRTRADSPKTASASANDEPNCPLAWLLNHCGFCH